MDKEAEKYSKCSGPVSKGCKLCSKGEKMVLFATGLCGEGCFYCPISKARKGKTAFANEKPVISVEEIIAEAERTEARGAGITGGNPLLELKLVCESARKLKERFGSSFHLHIYLPSAKKDALEKLYDAGIDEIRFHWGDPKEAMEFGWAVGGEVPLVPGWEKRTEKFIELLQRREAQFCNLNELDISETNFAELGKRGMKRREELSYGIEGSEKMGLDLLKKEFSIPLHYCSSAFKDRIQLSRRFLRTARIMAKPFEIVSEEGTVLSGVLEGEAEIEAPHYFLDGKTFCAPDVARKLASVRKASLVEWVPTWDREKREVTPL